MLKINILKREILIKGIAQEFAIIKNRIDYLSEANLRDQNIIYEYHIQEILNVIYDLKLVNSNSIKSNAVAIDLQDDDSGVAVQVTVTSAKSKIQETLSKFEAAGLQSKYDVLLIVILGNKQRKYSGFTISSELHFDPQEHIIDFGKIISKLMSLPTLKVEKIRNILEKDKFTPGRKANPIIKFKKNKSVRKSLEGLLHKNISPEDYEMYYFVPNRKFIYDSLIIRSVEDTSFPNFSEDVPNPLAMWYKAQIHNLYEFGIEVIPNYYERIVRNVEGQWNYLGQRDIKEIREGLEVITTNIIHRIPFNSMVELDMETDGYYGYPSLYLDYSDLDGFEEVPIEIGYYNDSQNYRNAHYYEQRNKNESL